VPTSLRRVGSTRSTAVTLAVICRVLSKEYRGSLVKRDCLTLEFRLTVWFVLIILRLNSSSISREHKFERRLRV